MRGYFYSPKNQIEYASFNIPFAVRGNGQAVTIPKNFDNKAMTSERIKDTYVQSQVERRSGGITLVSRRNQRGHPGENRGEVKFLWVKETTERRDKSI